MGLVYRWYRKAVALAMRVRTGYSPFLPDPVDPAVLTGEIARFLGVPRDDVQGLYQRYRALSDAERYADRFGERKTLCFEEAFILTVLLERLRPATVVEIGTQYGNSTRRILDATSMLGLKSKVVCFDIEDNVREFKKGEEAELRLRDVTQSFGSVLEELNPGLIYLDAHPWNLLESVIAGVMQSGRDIVLAIHDCTHGIYNANMLIPREEPNVTTATGVWERHVLAKLMGVADASGAALDECATATHALRIFPTPHGLAVLAPKRMLPLAK